MDKRRKVRCIVGGVLGSVVLLYAVSVLLKMNSPGAKLELAAQEIITQQDLKYRDSMVAYVKGSGGDQVISDIYEGVPISQEKEKRILAQLSKACPTCTIEVVTVDLNYKLVTEPISEATIDIYFVYTPEGSNIRNLILIFDNKGLSTDGIAPTSNLTITKYSDPRLWSFLKRLWPW